MFMLLLMLILIVTITVLAFIGWYFSNDWKILQYIEIVVFWLKDINTKDRSKDKK